MARIAGVNIPTAKRVIIALTYIHGIGAHKAKAIATKLGIDHSRRVADLSDQEVLHIRETIDAEHTVEGDLRVVATIRIKKISWARTKDLAGESVGAEEVFRCGADDVAGFPEVEIFTRPAGGE